MDKATVSHKTLSPLEAEAFREGKSVALKDETDKLPLFQAESDLVLSYKTNEDGSIDR